MRTGDAIHPAKRFIGSPKSLGHMCNHVITISDAFVVPIPHAIVCLQRHLNQHDCRNKAKQPLQNFVFIGGIVYFYSAVNQKIKSSLILILNRGSPSHGEIITTYSHRLLSESIDFISPSSTSYEQFP